MPTTQRKVRANAKAPERRRYQAALEPALVHVWAAEDALRKALEPGSPARCGPSTSRRS